MKGNSGVSLHCQRWLVVGALLISIFVPVMADDRETATTAAAETDDDYKDGDGEDVIQDLRLDEEIPDQTLRSGDKLQFRCKVSISPKKQLNFTWYHRNIKIDPESDERVSIRTRDWGSRLQILNVYTADDGIYRCEASDGDKSVQTSAKLVVSFITPPSDPVPQLPEGKCELYRGVACQEYLKGKYVFVESFQEQEQMEGQLTLALPYISDFSKVSEECSKYARPAFCHFVFPQCEYSTNEIDESDDYGTYIMGNEEVDDRRSNRGRAMAIKLCREDCELMQYDVCANEFSSTDKDIKKVVEGTDCTKLPRTTATGAKCLRLGLKSVVDRTHLCYNDTGVTYMGVGSTAENEQICKTWPTNMFPQHPELVGGHNFCRNPGNANDKPWCFVDKNRVKKVSCSVTKCKITPAASSDLLMILIPCVSIPLLIGCIVAVMCITCKRKKEPRHTQGKRVEMRSVQNRKLEIPELPGSVVHFSIELGEGKYGKVYKAQIMSNMTYSPTEPVAAKTVAAGAMQTQINEFQREMEMYADLQHINVSCLKACVVQPTLRCMIFEYTSRVDLHELLTLHSPHSDIGGGKISGSASSHTSSSLEEGDFLHMAVQVASGLEYLASRSFIHRDLAARNILVCSNNIMKISNLGVVRDCYLSSYYRSPQGGHMLPVRWMAPESLANNMFSEKTVVWSFGVMVWEMFSYGLQPYCGYNNHEVIDIISKGQTLVCPDQCSSRVYALLRECWSLNTDQRPTCKELHAKLSGWEGATTTRMTSQLAQGVHRQLNNVMRDGSQFQYSPTPQGTDAGSYGQKYMASPQQPEPPHANQAYYSSQSASSSGLTSHAPPSYPTYIQQPQAYPPAHMYPQQQMHFVRPQPSVFPYKPSHTHSSSRSTDSGGSSVRNQRIGFGNHPPHTQQAHHILNHTQHQQFQPQREYVNIQGTPDSGVHSSKGVQQPQNIHDDHYHSGSVTSGSPVPPHLSSKSRPGSELVTDVHKPVQQVNNVKPTVAPKPPISPIDSSRPRVNIVMGVNGQRNCVITNQIDMDNNQLGSRNLKNEPSNGETFGSKAMSCDSGLPNDDGETDSGENQPFLSKPKTDIPANAGIPHQNMGSSSSSVSGSTSVTTESRLTS